MTCPSASCSAPATWAGARSRALSSPSGSRVARTAAGRRATPSEDGLTSGTEWRRCRKRCLNAENSNAIALGLIGDEWNLAIARLAIMSGVRRYKEFRDRLGIANSVLTARLRRLDRGRRVHHGAVLRRAAPVRVRAHRARPRPVEGAADHLVVGSGLGDRARRAAAADVPHRVRRGVLPGHALPGLRPAGRHRRCARHVRPERRLRAVGAARHHPAPLRGRLARARAWCRRPSS